MPRIALKRTRVSAVRSAPIHVDYPSFIAPCQARIIGRPPSGANWVHEIKHDGFRSQIHVRDGKIIIYSKSGYDWTDRYAPVAKQTAKLDAGHAVIDGEMVVQRDNGTCDLWALQAHVHGTPSERLAFYAFDLLFLDGEDLRQLPLKNRKERLQNLIASAS